MRNKIADSVYNVMRYLDAWDHGIYIYDIWSYVNSYILATVAY